LIPDESIYNFLSTYYVNIKECFRITTLSETRLQG